MRLPPAIRRITRTGRQLPVLALAVLAGAAGALDKREVSPVFDAAAAPAQGAREPARSTGGKAIDRILRDIEKKHRAKVVKQEERDDDGRKVLVLRLLSDEGRVWTVRVDAESGKEL